MSLNRGDYKRRRLQRLFDEQGGKCHWCGHLCLMAGQPGYLKKNGVTLGARAATTDHLYSRLNPLRGKVGGKQLVMACSSCNKRRGHEEVRQHHRDQQKMKELSDI